MIGRTAFLQGSEKEDFRRGVVDGLTGCPPPIDRPAYLEGYQIGKVVIEDTQ